MNLNILKRNEGLKILSQYEKVSPNDYALLSKDTVDVLAVFNVPKVKSLPQPVSENDLVDFVLTSSTLFDDTLWLLLDIEVKGHNNVIKLAFDLDSGIPEKLLQIDFLLLLYKGKTAHVKLNNSIDSRHLFALASHGSLLIELEHFRECLEPVIESMVLVDKTIAPLMKM